MDIDYIYQLCQSIVNKYKQGYLSPTEFNNYFNLAQNQYFNYLCGLPEAYPERMPLDGRGKMYSQTMQERLSPFYVNLPITLNGAAKIIKPANFGSIIELIDPNGNPCNARAQNKYGNWINDSIDVNSLTSSFCIDGGSYYQVYPATGWAAGSSFTLNYYMLPPVATWTMIANTVPPQYNLAGSTQPLWNNNEASELIARVVSLAGINLSNSQVIQYSQLQKSAG